MTKFRIIASWVAISFIVLLAMLIYGSMMHNQSKTEGEIFREQAVNEYHAKKANRSSRMADLTPFCKAARFEGMSLVKVQKIFSEAGGKVLVDVSTLPESFRRANDYDYFGGVDMGSSIIEKVSFSMSFRVRRLNGIAAVSEISSCGVISDSL